MSECQSAEPSCSVARIMFADSASPQVTVATFSLYVQRYMMEERRRGIVYDITEAARDNVLVAGTDVFPESVQLGPGPR